MPAEPTQRSVNPFVVHCVVPVPVLLCLYPMQMLERMSCCAGPHESSSRPQTNAGSRNIGDAAGASKTLPKSLEPQLEHLLVGRDRDL